MIATTYPEFGLALSRARHVHFVGPIREPHVAEKWPRRFPERPFVLVSFSTISQQQEATLARVCEALAPLPVEALVTTGRSIAPESLPLAGGVEAGFFVPHDAVLPSVDLTIGHGGLGTIMYSLGAGKPCLCLAAGRDQGDNAARVAALGLGRALPIDASPAEIRDSVAAILADDTKQANCRAFAAKVSRFGDLPRAADLVEHCAAA